jgi:hypothetical protein
MGDRPCGRSGSRGAAWLAERLADAGEGQPEGVGEGPGHVPHAVEAKRTEQGQGGEEAEHAAHEDDGADGVSLSAELPTEGGSAPYDFGLGWVPAAARTGCHCVEAEGLNPGWVEWRIPGWFVSLTPRAGSFGSTRVGSSRDKAAPIVGTTSATVGQRMDYDWLIVMGPDWKVPPPWSLITS